VVCCHVSDVAVIAWSFSARRRMLCFDGRNAQIGVHASRLSLRWQRYERESFGVLHELLCDSVT
jgi:hypothetical protein